MVNENYKAIHVGKNNFKIYIVINNSLEWGLAGSLKIAGQCLVTVLVSTSQRGCSRTGKSTDGNQKQ